MVRPKRPKPSKQVRGRILNVQPDPPDIRDRMYEPALIQLAATKDAPQLPTVIDQGDEGSCTGCALAGVINLLNTLRGHDDIRVSPRMLYEMAKRSDEFPGEDYEGSSLRGAIRGWHAMGVCSEKAWPYVAGNGDDQLTLARAVDARMTTLGAYYRLRPSLPDYHAALNEVEAVYVSANIHDGWFNPVKRKDETRPGGLGRAIPHIEGWDKKRIVGGHAFAIVGYNADGFYVLNSWGSKWGKVGIALWPYEDWITNVVDAWVVRLALPVPQIFGWEPGRKQVPASGEFGEEKAPPTRAEIAGHFVHFDDGHFAKPHRYWSDLADVKITADHLKNHPDYKHLVIYAHGGLNTPTMSATRIRALKEGFRRNGIYPYHVMYDTGLGETVKDVILQALGLAEKRAAGFLDWTDTLIENAVRKPVTPIWEEMKRDADLPFKVNGDGSATISTFTKTLGNSGIKIHLIGHSTGGVLLGHLLNALDRVNGPVPVQGCYLMAPACTVDFFKSNYRNRIGKSNTASSKAVGLPTMRVYNLTDELERDDNVAGAYRKSLLYLVSRAFERTDEMPILGMARYKDDAQPPSGMEFVFSTGKGKRTQSTSHGGFDNDPFTLNDILEGILGHRPKLPFTDDDVRY